MIDIPALFLLTQEMCLKADAVGEEILALVFRGSNEFVAVIDVQIQLVGDLVHIEWNGMLIDVPELEKFEEAVVKIFMRKRHRISLPQLDIASGIQLVFESSQQHVKGKHIFAFNDYIGLAVGISFNDTLQPHERANFPHVDLMGEIDSERNVAGFNIQEKLTVTRLENVQRNQLPGKG